MAVSVSAQWRIRAGGSELNGGGFDPTISGAGTDYTDQDTAQLSLTDITTTGISATIGSVVGGFTSAMIGNCMRIASGTNFTAGYYFITAVPSANSATLDRNCTSGIGALGVGKIGGAWADLRNASTGGNLPSPVISSPFVSGNSLFLCGSGTSSPTSVDYNFSGGYWQFPDSGSDYSSKIIGYNGRPLISTAGLLFNIEGWQYWNLCFKQVNTNISGWGYTSGGYSQAHNCRFDSNGFDDNVSRGSLYDCEELNSGGGSATTTVAHRAGIGAQVVRTNIHGQRGRAIELTDGAGCQSINDSIISDNGSDGIYSALSGILRPAQISGNTIANNGGHGINTANWSGLSSARNLITGHAGSGKKGFNYSGSDVITLAISSALSSANNFYGNTADASFTLDATNTTLNPSYVGSGDYTPTNASLLIPYTVGQP